ncbi:MAG: YbaK/EbsC family protein [Burkholderiales bacterium]|nr:YbaK/EbsC family protein [Burkholderiales bacterium]
MVMAPSLQDFLAMQQIAYDVVGHPHTGSSMESAAATHVPGDRVAKGVVLEDERGYVLAVLPSTHHVEVDALGRCLHRSLRLATEGELVPLFGDCARGAVPPVGEPYGIVTVVEEALEAQPEVYFEAGDHEHFVRLTQSEFDRLMGAAVRAHFSRRF